MKVLSWILSLGLLITITSCGDDEDPMMTPTDELTIWSGPRITFSKTTADDPNDPAFQDRITDNVWLTRTNDMGQLINIKVESSPAKEESPVGVEWAVGTTADVSGLTFGKFREVVGKPKEQVGQNLVMHLLDDDIYIDFKLLSWGQGSNGQGGTVSYERTTQ